MQSAREGATEHTVALDDADKKFITDLLAAKDEATDKRIGDTLKSQIAALGLDKIGDTVKALGADLSTLKAPKTDDAPDDGKGKGKQASPAEQAQAARLEKLENDLKAERRAARESARDTAIREALGANGITDPARVKAALPVILASIPHEIGDDGAVSWKIEENGVQGVPRDTATAIKAFAASDTGKLFVPASGVNGSGDKNQQRQQGAQGGPFNWAAAADKIAN